MVAVDRASGLWHDAAAAAAAYIATSAVTCLIACTQTYVGKRACSRLSEQTTFAVDR